MKNTTIITMAALLLGSSGLMAQTTAVTKPSGFVTHTLKAGQFNLIGLTLHNAVTVTGKFSAVSGTTLTDANVDFDTTLTAGKTYILEITSGALEGTIQEVTEWSGNSITTSANLADDGLKVDDNYQLRKVKTLTDIFGVSNESGLLASPNANPFEADMIFLPKQDGGFNRYFYSTLGGFTGWLDADTFAIADPSIVYADGIIVQRRGVTDLKLILTGSVKTTVTTIALTESFNYIGSIFPVGSNLDSSKLADSLQASANANPFEADVVYVPNGSGGYDQYFYSTLSGFSGWLNSATFAQAGSVELSSGIIIQKRAPADKNASIAPPAGYTDL